MRGKHLILLAAALLLCGGSATLAARSTSQTKAADNATSDKANTTIYHRSGTISSVTGSDLTLEHKWKGKDENTEFVLNSDTKKEGTLDKGEKAIVYYRMENKQRVATDVKVTETKKS
jgi:hypothetical protein